MSPILDPQGNPLPPTTPQPDVLDQMCNNRDRVPGAWAEMMNRYDVMLAQLEPNAGPMLDMLSGKVGLDATNQAGQRFVQLVVDIALATLVLRRHAFRESAREAERLEQNGGECAPN